MSSAMREEETPSAFAPLSQENPKGLPVTEPKAEHESCLMATGKSLALDNLALTLDLGLDLVNDLKLA